MDILSAASRYRMFQPGDLVVCAVSGGPDSVAMLHALHTRASEFGISLHIAHINHGLRGEQSNIDEVFTGKLAQQFGIPITTTRVDVPRIMRETGMGEEEAAREVRYKFLQETYTNLGASKIAVAHTADDRAESVLLNIIRGAGTTGLGSIRPVRGNVVRPLIETTRNDVMAYIEEHGLPFRIDETNTDIRYARNRVRHELIPLLKEHYNPRVIDSLTRLADITLAEDDLLGEQTQSTTRSLLMGGALDAGLIAQLSIAVRRRVIRAEIERHKGNLIDVSLEQVDRVIAALESGLDFTITLPSGRLVARRSSCDFAIRPLEPVRAPVSFERMLIIPGTTEIPEWGLLIRAEIVGRAEPAKLPPTRVIIDPGILAGPLRVRNILPGDRITPFGMAGTKKLQDVFVDKKIHRRERARAVVVTDSEKILWVVGVLASESTRIAGPIRNAIALSAEALQTQ